MIKIIAVGLVSLLLFLTINGFSQKTQPFSSKKKKPDITGDGFRSPFRYVIISGVSELEQYVNENPENTDIEVLMEDRAFNERNLRILFQILSERFKEKSGLSVEVYTSLDAIRTPEENESIDLKGPIDNYEKYKYAFYTRNGYGEHFQYGIPNRVFRKDVFMKAPPSVQSPK